MKYFHAVTYTHSSVGIEQVGAFHIAPENLQNRLQSLLGSRVEELLFLSTCNRVEMWFRTEEELTADFLNEMLAEIYPDWSQEQVDKAEKQALVYSHLEAVDHVFRVAGSLDSLVVGEREIISQIKDAYQNCKEAGLTGDFIRILMRKTIETAKQVFTETLIANRPVSIVNLAYRRLIEQGISTESGIVVVGAGKTNKAMLLKLKKAGYTNFYIFNRTLSRAENLVREIGGQAFALSELKDFQSPFDALITCTGSEEVIITPEIYASLNPEQPANKTIIDLAVPADTHSDIVKEESVEFIGVESLKDLAAKNLELRKGELHRCEAIVKENLDDFVNIHKVRQVELAMRKVPEQVKDIRRRAVEEVFAREIDELDQNSRETLDKVVSYLEKKYMSTPMLLAKEILLKEEKK
ncbi:glutamyl-tRNA reductase [bacterium SCSIO 12741]|nr:glutamyl-tRNA reductase [bacterium SCSIO 12741]